MKLVWLTVSFTIIIHSSNAALSSVEKNKAYFSDLLTAITEIVDFIETAAEDVVQVVVNVEPSDVKIYCYNQSSINESLVSFDLSDTSALNDVFDSSKVTYVIVHGWNNDYTSDVNIVIKRAVLERHNVNLFVVDWNAFVGYVYAFDSVPYVGRYLGEFLNNISESYNYSLSNVRMAGHSLGAHICGVAGNVTGGKIKSIAGLDPAGPLYNLENDTSIKLSPDDAMIVEVLHTNMNLYGIKYSIGASDYYANGGASQPSCNVLTDFEGCSHSAAYEYFAESVASGGFTSIQCQIAKGLNSTSNYCCNPLNVTYMGQFTLDERAKGNYYLSTNVSQPYALGRKFGE